MKAAVAAPPPAARRVAAHALACALMAGAGCAATLPANVPVTPDCAAPARRMVRDVLYLGAALPGGGEIDGARWARFQREEIVPRLGTGATVIAAQGFWRDRDVGLTIETTRLLVVLHDGSAAMLAAVGEIAARYRDVFAQQSVLREQGQVCASF